MKNTKRIYFILIDNLKKYKNKKWDNIRESFIIFIISYNKEKFQRMKCDSCSALNCLWLWYQSVHSCVLIWFFFVSLPEDPLVHQGISFPRESDFRWISPFPRASPSWPAMWCRPQRLAWAQLQIFPTCPNWKCQRFHFRTRCRHHLLNKSNDINTISQTTSYLKPNTLSLSSLSWQN